MTKSNTVKVVGALLATVSMLTLSVSTAAAQVVPSGSPSPTAALNTSPASVPAQNQALPEYVMLADYVPRCVANGTVPYEQRFAHCQVPRAARPSTIAEDSPLIERTAFIRDYPHVGAEGFARIAGSNVNLCEHGNAFMQEILQLDVAFADSDTAYTELMKIYEALPDDIRGATRVATISSVASTGALCILSLGLYCIAAVASAVGYNGTLRANERLSLANIRLSIANIRLTRLNIVSNRLTLRMDAFWLDLVVPYCIRAFGEGGWLGGEVTTSYSSSMSRVEIPAQ